jgi:hypothetical protein
LRNFKNFLSERRNVIYIEKKLFKFEIKIKIPNKEKTGSNDNLKSRKNIIVIGKKNNYIDNDHINEIDINKDCLENFQGFNLISNNLIQEKNSNQIEDLEYASKTLARPNFTNKNNNNKSIQKEKEKKLLNKKRKKEKNKLGNSHNITRKSKENKNFRKYNRCSKYNIMNKI